MFDTADWLGYEFEVNDPDTVAFWHVVPGLYIFAGVNLAGEWFPLYIGSTKSLAGRLPYHPKWLTAKLFGATHIHARMERLKNVRESLEQKTNSDLSASFKRSTSEASSDIFHLLSAKILVALYSLL